ncbi:nitronate monooxygenase family protein [Mycobacterium sp. 3519A]|uniref:NAD(P)H-dependent flavin oxidoreductase n=1 Tax=Mycobacterium sp. 3519A TaxID=2057184 RepID=UPI000C7C24DB|nr:nitronate monooxygenase [Mycobacterium sp. 3519A]
MDLLDRLRVDVPVAQAGMGGGLAGPELAAAVAAAGGLGTLGLLPPAQLRTAISDVRDAVPDRAVAVNLLMPFVRRKHVEVCIQSRIDVAVIAFGMDRNLVQRLSEQGVFVFVMVGTEEEAQRACSCGANGLIAQGGEAGGHLSGTTPALDFLPRALAVARGRPVLLAGGVATAEDTRAAMAAGAAGVVAGTRFLLTDESRAHPAYQRRILNADKTIRTTLFGMGWPLAHRVVANAATERWCRGDGRARLLPRMINAGSGKLARFPDRAVGSVLRMQTRILPFFSPITPTVDMPESVVDHTALYAGDSVLRMTSVISAQKAVTELAPK